MARQYPGRKQINLKIAISSTGRDLGSEMDAHFGRCPYFILVDPDTMHFEALDNTGLTASTGSGIAAAQLVASLGAGLVLTGVCGPNASNALSAAGIKTINGLSGKIEDIIARYQAGSLV
jgi:predicted Fe-Mo cluster-binding NifX family protein